MNSHHQSLCTNADIVLRNFVCCTAFPVKTFDITNSSEEIKRCAYTEQRDRIKLLPTPETDDLIYLQAHT